MKKLRSILGFSLLSGYFAITTMWCFAPIASACRPIERVWVRFSKHEPVEARWFGPFDLAAMSEHRHIGEGDPVVWGENAGVRRELATKPWGADGWVIEEDPREWDTVRFLPTEPVE